MQSTLNDKQSNNYAWVILFIVYLATVSSGIMMNKVSPSIPTMVDVFGINLSQAGLLMSVYALTAVLLAIPAGILISKFGQLPIAIVAFLSLILGSVIGAMAQSFDLMLVSRMFEGIGSAFIVVLGPALIARWFPAKKSGMPVGIWSTATPVGGFIALTYIPALNDQFGWRNVWWGAAIITFLALLFFVVLFKPLPGGHKQETTVDQIVSIKKLFRNKSIWLAGLTIMCFTMVIMPIVTYYPTFLSVDRGFDLSMAGFYVGLISIATLPISPFAGWFSDRIGSRKVVVITGFLILFPLFATLFMISGWAIPVFMILIGVSVATIPTPLFAAATDLVGDIRMAGYGMAVLTIGLNMGTVVSAPIFGALAESYGWNIAAFIFAPFALLGIFVSYKNKEFK
jgi:predicted MFS family arabinose efflux permease